MKVTEGIFRSNNFRSSNFDSWRFSRLVLAVGFVSLGMFAGCNGSKNSQTTPAATDKASTFNPAALPAAPSGPRPVPASLHQLGESGEDLYDAGKAGKWKQADEKLATLKTAAQAEEQDLASNADAKGRLDAEISALDTAVAKHNRPKTMGEANQVTLVAADLSAPYQPKIPADVARLDYDGRELEIWSAAHDLPKLKATAAHLRATWDQVRPQVEAHNGADVAKHFDALVGHVDAAKSVAEYHRTAKPILDEVDKLEAVF